MIHTLRHEQCGDRVVGMRYAQILVEAANFGKIFARCARKQILDQILENMYPPQAPRCAYTLHLFTC